MQIDDQTIAVYDAQVDAYSKVPAAANEPASLVRFLSKLPPGGTILDLGCGPGIHANQMQARGSSSWRNCVAKAKVILEALCLIIVGSGCVGHFF